MFKIFLHCLKDKVKKKKKEHEKKTKVTSVVKLSKVRAVQGKEKKVFDLPGQKHEQPSEVCFPLCMCMYFTESGI